MAEKIVVKFAPPAVTGVEPLVDLELQGDAITIANPGVFVVQDGNDVIGVFPLMGVAGIFRPEGKGLIQITEGIVLK